VHEAVQSASRRLGLPGPPQSPISIGEDCEGGYAATRASRREDVVAHLIHHKVGHK
jgi:hypothetical protein